MDAKKTVAVAPGYVKVSGGGQTQVRSMSVPLRLVRVFRDTARRIQRARSVTALLYLIASLWRRVLFRTTFVAVSGSLGKTTAKESLGRILRSRYRTFVSVRDENARSFVSLNVLRVRPWHKIAVFEVASGGPGWLAPPSRLLRPHLAILLRVARTHTKEYRSLEETADEKWQILAGLKPGGILLLNADDPLLAKREVPAGIRRVTFGTSPSCDYVASNVQAAWPDRMSFAVHHAAENAMVRTPLVGAQWVTSVLAAVAASVELGLTVREAAAAAAGLIPFPARMQPVRLPSGATVIRDEYNGSVDSVDAALRFLAEAHAPRRILVSTIYTDSDERPDQRMARLGREASRICDVAVFVGWKSRAAAKAAVRSGMPPDKVKQLHSLRSLADFLRQEVTEGDLVLVKGRTTDHLSRAILAQFGRVRCLDTECKSTQTCDFCWKLGLGRTRLKRVNSPSEPLSAACSGFRMDSPPGGE